MESNLKFTLEEVTSTALNLFTEARGRPRKNPLPVNKDGEEEESGPEPSQHIMNQVRKAADSGMKPFHVTYSDGSKHPLTRTQARAVMAKYNKLKPHEKEDMQAEIAKSHEHMLKHC